MNAFITTIVVMVLVSAGINLGKNGDKTLANGGLSTIVELVCQIGIATWGIYLLARAA